MMDDGLEIGLETRNFSFFPVLNVLMEPHSLHCKACLSDLLEQSYFELGINKSFR